MTQNKFTPWPWVRNKYESLVGGNGKEVTVYNTGLSNAGKTDESVANAKLISAAPDGFNAAVDAIEHMEWSTPKGKEAYDALVAFVAKARGE